MASIEKLEDLMAWKEAVKLSALIFETCKKLPTDEKYNLRDHLWGNARNIPGNIAEGFGRYNYQESMQFYRIARGSLNEVKSDIYLCLYPCGYISKEEHQKVIDQIEVTGKFINGLINSTYKVKLQNKKTNN